MATVYPAARNLCAAVTYTRSRSLPNHAAMQLNRTKEESYMAKRSGIYLHSRKVDLNRSGDG